MELGPDLIVDDGGDATLLIHKGYELEEFYENNYTPEVTTTIEEEQVIEKLLRDVLKKFNTLAINCQKYYRSF